MDQLREWIERYKKEIVLFILFFLISTISFALGYLFSKESVPAPIIIQKASTS